MYEIASILNAILGFGLLAALLYASWRFATGRGVGTQDKPRDPRCPRCGYDLRASPETCPECGHRLPEYDALDRRALREDWPAAEVTPRRPDPDESEVTVHSTPVASEAQLLGEQLTARGVQAEVRRTTGSGSNVELLPTGILMHVVVWSGDEDLARGYVESLRASTRRKRELEAARPAEG